MIPSAVQQKLQSFLPSSTKQIRIASVGGGCINETYRIDSGEDRFFCKINSASKFPHLFKKEMNGLQFIGSQQCIRVPSVIGCFEDSGYQVLLLEWIDEGNKTEEFWKKFGEQLAAMHQVTHSSFGFAEDNYMGSIPQSNEPMGQWTSFFELKRLQPLVHQCLTLQLLSKKHQAQFHRIYEKLPEVFGDLHQPALLHGDLWSGNFMCAAGAEPVLIDTAVYFGHPSVDLAMTTLFGGFRPGFYEAYRYHSPLSNNHSEQWHICNLYPLLIHLLLFGRGYLSQIEQTLHRYS